MSPIVSGWKGQCLCDGVTEVARCLSGGTLAPPAADWHLDRDLLAACLPPRPSNVCKEEGFPACLEWKYYCVIIRAK
jgi:hypothetical protein